MKKTFILVGLATHIALGHPVGTTPVKRGQVIYIPAEDEWGARMRAVAAGRSFNVEFDEVPLIIIPPPCLVQDSRFAEAIIEIAEALTAQSGEPTVLVILDTIGAAYGAASANDDAALSGAASSLLRIARTLSCSIIAVHHVGKDESRGMLGSIVLRNRADTVIRLTRGSDPLTVRGKVEKQRNGLEGAQLTFRFEPCCLGEQSTLNSLALSSLEVIQPDAQAEQSSLPRTARLPPDTLIALEVLVSLTDVSGHASEYEWRNRTFSRWGERKDGAKRTAWSKATSILKERGLILLDGSLVSVSDLSAARQQLLAADRPRSPEGHHPSRSVSLTHKPTGALQHHTEDTP